jgi:hypothetical protein
MGKFADDITTFCAPSQVNLLFGVIGFVIAFTTVGIIGSFSHLFVTLLWCLLLNYMCSIGWTTVAWFLVLWPFIVLILCIVVYLIVMGGQDLNYIYDRVGVQGPNSYIEATATTPGMTYATNLTPSLTYAATRTPGVTYGGVTSRPTGRQYR